MARIAARCPAALMAAAERPIFYTGGGVVNSGPKAAELLTALVRKTGFPCTNTLMGLGAFPASDPLFLGMLGMHGSYATNTAICSADLLIAIGARFDDRVTGRVKDFASRARKIHFDVDPSEVNKNVAVDLALVGDARETLQSLLTELKHRAKSGVARATPAPTSPNPPIFFRSPCKITTGISSSSLSTMLPQFTTPSSRSCRSG